MMNNSSNKSFSLLCNHDGYVTKIIKDESFLLPTPIVGKMIFSIAAFGDLNKIINFFVELKLKKFVANWEIKVITQQRIEKFFFFGVIFEDHIGITAATTKNRAKLIFNEFFCDKIEHSGFTGAPSEEPSVTYFEEISRLNNDLVNMLRELCKKNHELGELNKIKNEFLGIAAHDLRNPLYIIQGFSNHLLEDAKESFSEDQLIMLTSIFTSSEYMLRLLNDLLDVSAIESGQLGFNLEFTNLVTIVRQTVDLNRLLAQKKDIDIVFIQPGEIPMVKVDRPKIEQILNNLLSNAVKFSYPGSDVNVKMNLIGSEIVVSVQDHGQGIPEDELEKLFDPYKTTSIKGTKGEKSTGLGLSIVRKLVLGHMGKIWVESTVGKGSSFYFSFPV